MIMLKNPRRKKKRRSRRRKTTKRRRRNPVARKAKRRPPKGFRTWRAYMASIRPNRRKRRKGGSTMAKRKRRRRSAPRRRRRRAPRRNPRGFKIPTMRGVFAQIQTGVVDAAEVVIGKAAARAIPTAINLPKEGPMGLLIQAGTAIVVGMLGVQFISKNAGKMMLAGALAAPVESLIAGLNIPFISPALAPVGMGLYPQLYSYPQVGAGAAAEPVPTGLVDWTEDAAYAVSGG